MNVFPSENKKLYIEIFYTVDTGPFVCGVNGHVTIEMLEEIEINFIENSNLLDRGEGFYLFEVNCMEEYGLYKSENYREILLIEFKPIVNFMKENKNYEK